MALLDSVNFILATLTLISGIALILVAIFFVLGKTWPLPKTIGNIRKQIQKNSLLLSLIVAATATLGSLFYSEIAGFEPCRLCWLQRIFMYPMVIIYGVALYKKDTHVWIYTLPLSLIGAAIAGYHYYIQRFASSIVCEIGVPCTTVFTFHFGYITIPMMALTAFLMIILLSIRNLGRQSP